MLEIVNLRYSWANHGESHGGEQSTEYCFNLEVDGGSILVVQGKSGIGKSTLLSLIAGLLPAAGGSIFWQGRDITQTSHHQRPLSILFQDNNLFGHLDCRTNIALGVSASLRLDMQQWRGVDAAMEHLGIGDMGVRLPETLSGGQQQRVALARALLRARMKNCSLLLLDEPFNGIDPEMRAECCRITRAMVADEGLTALVVSHDNKDVLQLDARSFVLQT